MGLIKPEERSFQGQESKLDRLKLGSKIQCSLLPFLITNGNKSTWSWRLTIWRFWPHRQSIQRFFPLAILKIPDPSFSFQYPPTHKNFLNGTSMSADQTHPAGTNMSADQTHQATPSGSDSKHSPPNSGDYAPYPKLGPDDVHPPPIEDWSDVPMGSQPKPQQQTQAQAPLENPLNAEARAPVSADAATTMPPESNPYISAAPAPAPSSAVKSEWLPQIYGSIILWIWGISKLLMILCGFF